MSRKKPLLQWTLVERGSSGNWGLGEDRTAPECTGHAGRGHRGRGELGGREGPRGERVSRPQRTEGIIYVTISGHSRQRGHEGKGPRQATARVQRPEGRGHGPGLGAPVGC